MSNTYALQLQKSSDPLYPAEVKINLLYNNQLTATFGTSNDSGIQNLIYIATILKTLKVDNVNSIEYKELDDLFTLEQLTEALSSQSGYRINEYESVKQLKTNRGKRA